MNVLLPYIFSEEVNYMKYGLTILRRFFSNKETNLEIYSSHLGENEKLIYKLCSLLSFPDENVKHEVTWLLINITVYSPACSAILSNKENMDIIYDNLLFSNKILMDSIIWLIGNIICDVKDFIEDLESRNFTEFMLEKLNNNFFTYSIKTRLIWVLCNMVKNKKTLDVIIYNIS